MYTLVSLYVNPPFTCIPSSQSPLNLQIYLPPICLSVSCFFFFLLLPIFANLYIRFVRQSAYPFFCLPICVSLLYRRSANVRFPPIRMCVCPWSAYRLIHPFISLSPFTLSFANLSVFLLRRFLFPFFFVTSSFLFSFRRMTPKEEEEKEDRENGAWFKM